MGFFNRRTSAPDANTAPAVGQEGRRRHSRSHNRAEGAAAYAGNGMFNSRPSFGQWLKGTWLDIVTMAIMGAIGLGVCFKP